MKIMAAALHFSVRLRPVVTAQMISRRECFLCGAFRIKRPKIFPTGKLLWMRSMPFQKVDWSSQIHWKLAGSKAVISTACITTQHFILNKTVALPGREVCHPIRYTYLVSFQAFQPYALATLILFMCLEKMEALSIPSG